MAFCIFPRRRPVDLVTVAPGIFNISIFSFDWMEVLKPGTKSEKRTLRHDEKQKDVVKIDHPAVGIRVAEALLIVYALHFPARDTKVY